ncbi:hypothetical protein PSM73_13975 [Legionella pneumophila]|uniref:hypothetical protein n=1 Tax=Legionella pneumophila TaxID=446 RepID=UPI0026DFE9AE|nr:hypothetical protein [Legionella pneumophila]MDO5163087.1 hypothetical protein [Legionella pneumophila]
MINKLTKVMMVATSLAPILLTLWFISINSVWDNNLTFWLNIKMHYSSGIIYLISAISLMFMCWGLITIFQKKLEKIPVKILSAKTVDNEIVGFVLLYLFPLVNQPITNVNVSVLIFVSILFFIVIYVSNLYHFNPLLSFVGFHFYEVCIEGGITYDLITKKNITSCKNITRAVQLTDYMIMEI